MRKALVALGAVLILAATAAAQQPPAAPASLRVMTNEGSSLVGTIAGGSITLRTTFGGDVRLDPRRIKSFGGSMLTLDDGSVLYGTLSGGALQFSSAFGTLAIPADRVTEIQTPKPVAAAVVAPAAAAAPTPAAAASTPPATQTAAIPKPAAPAKKAAVQIVNDTRRNLSVCLNDEYPCLQLAPNGSANKTLDQGTLSMKVESTQQLGFVVLPTGSFQKAVTVDKDMTVRITDSDFR